MYARRSVMRVCAAVLLFAALLRLFLGLEIPGVWGIRPNGYDPLRVPGRQPGLLRPVGNGVGKPVVTTPQLPEQTAPPAATLPELTLPPATRPTQPPATSVPSVPAQPLVPGQWQKPVFGTGHLEHIKLLYESDCTHRPDLAALLQSPLQLQLQAQEPTVLILHSHGTECYTQGPGENFSWSGTYRTTDTAYNMVSIGDALTRILEGAGIGVIHDRTMHDQYSYSNAYHNSRASIEQYLQQYPSIQLVMDLHRDAASNPDGSQYAPTATVNGVETAQILFVMGTDLAAPNPYWQENLAVALKMEALLEQFAPGISRGTILRTSRYNQDLTRGTLLIEFGTAGNTHAQVLAAVPIVAKAIIALQWGTD